MLKTILQTEDINITTHLTSIIFKAFLVRAFHWELFAKENTANVECGSQDYVHYLITTKSYLRCGVNRLS